jgi:hypothetical protein
MVKRAPGHNALDMLQFAKPSLVSDISMVILTLKQERYQALLFDLTSASATPLLDSMQRLELSVFFLFLQNTLLCLFICTDRFSHCYPGNAGHPLNQRR